MKMVWTVVAVVCVGVVALLALNVGKISVPAAGTDAPEFTLPSQEGKLVSLKDYRGSWVVVYFYPRDFTHGCTIEARNFQRDQSQYQQIGATVLGISVDNVDSHKEFCTKEGLNFKLLADTDHKVSSAYGSVTNLVLVKFASRHTFLIDPNGKIVKAFTDVSPNKHSEEVLAALTELKHARGVGQEAFRQ